MRVLMFVPQYPYPVVGGLEKQSHELAKELISQGVEVQVISGKIQPEQADSERVDGVQVTRIPWSRIKPVRFLRTPIDVTNAIWQRRGTFDVIHLHQHSWVGLFVILLAKLLGKPIVTKLPNVGKLGLPGLRRGTFGWLRLFILLKSDAIVAMSAQSKQELMEAGYPLKRVLCTPNGISLNEPPVLREAAPANAGVCKVVFVGRLIDQKGVDVLLDAWSQICADVDGAQGAVLYLWGNGPLENDLKEKSKNLGLASKVLFCGDVPRVSTELPKMDVFVLPSWAEGNSNAILEAMAAGLPVVSTPVGGTPMLLGEAGRSFLCPPGDAIALGRCLLQLIGDRDLRLETGLAMRRRVELHFNISHVARTYSQAYGLLAAGQREKVAEVSNPVVEARE